MKRLKNHKNLAVFLIASLATLMLFAGCATAPNTARDIKAQSYVQNIESKSLREDKADFAGADCPRSEKYWQSENWTKLVKAANACVAEDRWDELARVARFLAIHHQLSPWGAYFLSLKAEHEKNYDKALWMAELALRKDPSVGLLQYQKGRVLWDQNQYTIAVDTIKQSLKSDPHIVDAKIFLGQVYLRDENNDLAAKYFQAALRQEPKNVIALAGMADLKIKTGSPDKAIAYLTKAIAVKPHNLSFRLKLAQVYEQQQHNYPQALLTYKTIKALLKAHDVVGHPDFSLDEKIKSLQASMTAQDKTEKASLRQPANQRKVTR